MSVINLSKVRKDRERTQKKADADLNAARHGRTKAERLAEAARDARARVVLDQHKFEDE